MPASRKTNMALDKDTAGILSESRELQLLIQGDGWKIARQRLINKIVELSDILALDEPDPQKLSIRLAVNKEAIKILLEWLVSIEGEKNNLNVQEMLKKEKTESYIKIIE